MNVERLLYTYSNLFTTEMLFIVYSIRILLFKKIFCMGRRRPYSLLAHSSQAHWSNNIRWSWRLCRANFTHLWPVIHSGTLSVDVGGTVDAGARVGSWAEVQWDVEPINKRDVKVVQVNKLLDWLKCKVQSAKCKLQTSFRALGDIVFMFFLNRF